MSFKNRGKKKLLYKYSTKTRLGPAITPQDRIGACNHPPSTNKDNNKTTQT